MSDTVHDETRFLSSQMLVKAPHLQEDVRAKAGEKRVGELWGHPGGLIEPSTQVTSDRKLQPVTTMSVWQGHVCWDHCLAQ